MLYEARRKFSFFVDVFVDSFFKSNQHRCKRLILKNFPEIKKGCGSDVSDHKNCEKTTCHTLQSTTNNQITRQRITNKKRTENGSCIGIIPLLQASEQRWKNHFFQRVHRSL